MLHGLPTGQYPHFQNYATLIRRFLQKATRRARHSGLEASAVPFAAGDSRLEPGRGRQPQNGGPVVALLAPQPLLTYRPNGIATGSVKRNAGMETGGRWPGVAAASSF